MATKNTKKVAAKAKIAVKKASSKKATSTKVEGEYGAKQIQVLEGLEKAPPVLLSWHLVNLEHLLSYTKQYTFLNSPDSYESEHSSICNLLLCIVRSPYWFLVF